MEKVWSQFDQFWKDLNLLMHLLIYACLLMGEHMNILGKKHAYLEQET